MPRPLSTLLSFPPLRIKHGLLATAGDTFVLLRQVLSLSVMHGRGAGRPEFGFRVTHTVTSPSFLICKGRPADPRGPREPRRRPERSRALAGRGSPSAGRGHSLNPSHPCPPPHLPACPSPSPLANARDPEISRFVCLKNLPEDSSFQPPGPEKVRKEGLGGGDNDRPVPRGSRGPGPEPRFASPHAATPAGSCPYWGRVSAHPKPASLRTLGCGWGGGPVTCRREGCGLTWS